MATRGSYVHNSRWQKFLGHPKNVSLMQFSQNIDGFRQNDSQGIFNLCNSIYKQNPNVTDFSFSLFTKLYIGSKFGGLTIHCLVLQNLY